MKKTNLTMVFSIVGKTLLIEMLMYIAACGLIVFALGICRKAKYWLPGITIALVCSICSAIHYKELKSEIHRKLKKEEREWLIM